MSFAARIGAKCFARAIFYQLLLFVALVVHARPAVAERGQPFQQTEGDSGSSRCGG